MIRLSIIVPIYGVEQYLRKCVDSLLNQDIPSSEYEIILVDDGGHDRCPQICDSYAASHKNIRVVHRENGGLSAARNSGIEVAQGKYVMFVDSDDYLETNVLRGLLSQTERDNLDVLRYDFRNVNEQYEEFNPYKYAHPKDIETAVADGLLYLNERMSYGCYAWQWIVRREMVPLFTEGIHFEDVDWLPRMMLKAKRVGSTQTIVYNYLWREGSITLTQGDKGKIKKNIEDKMYIIGQYGNSLVTYPNCKWLRNMQSGMVAGVLMTVAREFYDDRKEYILRMREMKVFPLAIANQGNTYVRRARVINILGANAYCAIMNIRK